MSKFSGFWFFNHLLTFAVLLGLTVAAVLAVARLRHLGSWLLLAGAVLQWGNWGLFILRDYFRQAASQELMIAMQIGLGGFGRLLMVAGMILIVVYARALQERAMAMEELAGQATRAGIQ